MSSHQLKPNLIKAISNVKGNGSFYSYGKSDFIIPRMKVDSELEVTFPLQRETAERLMDYSIQAPYGKGSDTLVDTKIRQTWEIDGSKITFGNPKWKNLLEAIVNTVKEDFSLQETDVEPHLYKLLLYEKGGFFLKHKDTEKEKGMFASLIINLPSEFTGGELEIEWNGESKWIDFSSHIFDFGFAAFYTDCDHEVHPIKSGYRLSLVYNLVKINDESQLGLSSLPKAIDEISDILVKMKEYKIDKPFLYLLEHQYTPTNFAVSNLKGNDVNRSSAILKAAKKAGYFADLGLLNHHIDGALDYEDYGRYNYMDEIDTDDITMSEIIDERIAIENWLKVYYPAIRNLELGEVEILNNRNYTDIEEAISSYAEGYMGNYGPSVEYDYHIGAVVLMPFQAIGNLITNANRRVLIGWMDYFLNNNVAGIDFDDLIHRFLMADSRNETWGKGDLDTLVDCIVAEVSKNKNVELVAFISEYLFALSSAKAALLIKNIDDSEVNKMIYSALVTFKGLKNYLAVLELYLELENNTTEGKQNALLSHSEFIFRGVSLIFEKENGRDFYFINRNEIISKILQTLLKISDCLSINHYLEPILVRKVNRKFIYTFLSPIVERNQSNKNELWQLFHTIMINKLQSYTNVKPQMPIDWKRDFDFTGKMDTQLEILKSFLLDVEKETYIYIKAQSYRSRMEDQINWLKLDISCSTVKKGSPYQLHLKKNTNSYREKLRKYEENKRLLELLQSMG